MWAINYLFACFTKCWICLNDLGVLIDSTSMLDDSLHFNFISRLMISREQEQLLSSISRHNSPTISSIGTVAHIINDKYDHRTTTRPVNLASLLLLALCKLKKQSLCLPKPISECLNRVLREMLIFDNELMQIIPKEICAHSSSMPIIDAKKRAFWPMLLFKVL